MLGWNNVVSTLFRRCFNVGQWRCFNVVQRWKSDVGFCFIFNVGPTLFQRWSTTLKQRWSDVEMLAGILVLVKIFKNAEYFAEFMSIQFHESIKRQSSRGVKIDDLQNFSKFTRKHLCQSFFFNKFAGLRPATLLKKRLWHRCFPLNFCEISKNIFSHRRPPVDGSVNKFFKISFDFLNWLN